MSPRAWRTPVLRAPERPRVSMFGITRTGSVHSARARSSSPSLWSMTSSSSSGDWARTASTASASTGQRSSVCAHTMTLAVVTDPI